ncbi:uncharacterized protein LOC116052664, partial [Tachysurus ichikawai]
MKQLYRVPFQYVQRIMELEAEEAHHKFIFVDEAGFNLCKVRRRGRNIIGQRATITVPGQRGANITMCAAISNDGVLCHIPTIINDVDVPYYKCLRGSNSLEGYHKPLP